MVNEVFDLIEKNEELPEFRKNIIHEELEDQLKELFRKIYGDEFFKLKKTR